MHTYTCTCVYVCACVCTGPCYTHFPRSSLHSGDLDLTSRGWKGWCTPVNARMEEEEAGCKGEDVQVRPECVRKVHRQKTRVKRAGEKIKRKKGNQERES